MITVMTLDVTTTRVYKPLVSPAKRSFTFAISDELKALLQEVRRREGIPEAEQIRRGLRLWFESKGYRFEEQDSPKAERKRVAARKRS